MVEAHTATAFWHHFHPQIIKKMDLETVSHFGTPNHRKSQKGLQSESQETPQMHHKINKNEHLDLKVPVGCPCGTPGSPQWSLRTPKWTLEVSKITVLGIKSDPFQQSTSQYAQAW